MHLFYTVSAEHCDDIAGFRSWAQKIGNNSLVFLDETYLRVSEAEETTLVAPGEQRFVVTESTSQYSPRYDMIAAVCGDRVFPPIIYAPSERTGRGVNAAMVERYIITQLAEAVGIMDRYPLYLICDQSTAHNQQRMLAAFHDAGCQEMVDVIFMPASSAKRVSPLDTALFHEWKQRCRSSHYISSKNIESIMTTAWEQTPVQHISNYYRLCGLTHRQSLYKDCPSPAQHHHPL